MHPGLRFTDGDDLRLGCREGIEPLADLVVGSEFPGQFQIRGMVPGLRFEEAAVKFPQLSGGDMVAKEGKSLATAGLDQPCHQQSVDRPPRLVATDEGMEPLAIAGGGEAAKGDAATLEEIEHQMEVGQFLGDDLGHCPGHRPAVDIGKEQIHRHAGGLLLAVGVIDEDLIQMGIHLVKPSCRSGSGEREHGNETEKVSLYLAATPTQAASYRPHPPGVRRPHRRQAVIAFDRPESIRKPPRDRNVLGESLVACSQSPLTGFLRDGCCRAAAGDAGIHTVCAVMTADFLEYTVAAGNDLVTPRPEWDFPGLVAGDRWCLCAARWLEAARAGRAPPVVLEATHLRTLDIVPAELLHRHAHRA